jgi:uncharacterized protein (DUF2147 family)
MLRHAIAGLIGLPTTLFMASAASANSDITGVWARGDGKAQVRIEPCGEHFCATNIWVKDTARGEAVGDTLVMMVKPDGADRLAGKAYDRKRKLTYSMEIRVEPDQLKSRGCVLGGLACRSVAWTRIP